VLQCVLCVVALISGGIYTFNDSQVSMLQCVAVCCSVLQCVAVYCSVLQCVVVCCSVLQCDAVCCSVLQYVVEMCAINNCHTHCNTLNTLQHTATHCSYQQQLAGFCASVFIFMCVYVRMCQEEGARER